MDGSPQAEPLLLSLTPATALCLPWEKIVPCSGDRIGNIFLANNELRHICKHPSGILCSHIAVARLVRACACIRLRQTTLSLMYCIGLTCIPVRRDICAKPVDLDLVSVPLGSYIPCLLQLNPVT
jgi:hypothetical protein